MHFRIPAGALIAFFGITFLITWTVIGAYIVFPENAARLLGEISGSHPLFFLATWSPAIAAFVVVFYHGGKAGILGLLSRLVLWRCAPGWVVFVLVIVPMVFVLGSLIQGGPVLAPLPPEGMGAMAMPIRA